FQDPAFLFGQFAERVLAACFLAQTFEHARGRLGVEQGAALRDRAHGADQVGAVDLFEDVSGGPCHDRTVECVVVGVGREHEHAGVREHGTDVPTDGDTITVGEPHGEYDLVGFEYRDAGYGLRGRSGLTDHLDAVLVVQEGTDPSSDDLVVVHQKHPDRRVVSHQVRTSSTSVTRGRPGHLRSWLSVVGVLVAHTPERMNGYGTP